MTVQQQSRPAATEPTVQAVGGARAQEKAYVACIVGMVGAGAGSTGALEVRLPR